MPTVEVRYPFFLLSGVSPQRSLLSIQYRVGGEARRVGDQIAIFHAASVRLRLREGFKQQGYGKEQLHDRRRQHPVPNNQSDFEGDALDL